jgi:hypothetical protein
MSAVLREIIRHPIKGFSGQAMPEAHLVKDAGLAEAHNSSEGELLVAHLRAIETKRET